MTTPFVTPDQVLIIGLGNPGPAYAGNRHNIGAMVADVLAARFSGRFKSHKAGADIAEGRLAGTRAVVAKPRSYMNLSGGPTAGLARFFKIPPTDVIVVHDELDLPPSVVRVKAGGGLAGNNGLRSITQHLHTQDYVRVRIGIGKPPSKERGAAHVLSKLSAADRKEMDVAVELAADVVELIIAESVDAAQRRFNGTTP